MKAKLLIPLCLFVAMQAAYDLFGKVQNTNWSIFYYTCQYAAWLVLIILLPKPANKLKKIPYFVLASGLILYIGLELSKMGMDYVSYYNSVNEFKQYILPLAVIIFGLTYFIFKRWRL